MNITLFLGKGIWMIHPSNNECLAFYCFHSCLRHMIKHNMKVANVADLRPKEIKQFKQVIL